MATRTALTRMTFLGVTCTPRVSMEEPCKARRIAWGMREDKELIYWHAILLSPKHPLRRVGAWVVGSDIRRGQAGTLQCVGCPRGTTICPRCRLDVLHDQHRQDCGGRYGPGNTPQHQPFPSRQAPGAHDNGVTLLRGGRVKNRPHNIPNAQGGVIDQASRRRPGRGAEEALVPGEHRGRVPPWSACPRDVEETHLELLGVRQPHGMLDRGIRPGRVTGRDQDTPPEGSAGLPRRVLLDDQNTGVRRGSLQNGGRNMPPREESDTSHTSPRSIGSGLAQASFAVLRDTVNQHVERHPRFRYLIRYRKRQHA